MPFSCRSRSFQTGVVQPFLVLAIVVGLIVGAAVILKAKNIISFPNIPGLSGLIQEQNKPRTERQTGNANMSRYTETVKGKDATYGASVKTTLKNGIDVYLIVPPGNNAAYAEVGEFRQLPTSPDQLPLYTDFGYGINAAFKINGSNTLNEPAYLVFDFSKGEVLKKLQKKNRGINRCDYSTVYFIPGVCAALLKVPAENTLNPRYSAVNPGQGADGQLPVLPLYSYYLGFDDLLIVRVDRNSIIIPQPLTKELAVDLINSTFQDYPIEHEASEAMDILRYFRIQINDQRILANIVQKFQSTGFKQLYAASYIFDLSQKAGTEAVKNEMSKKYEIHIQNMLDEFYKDATADNSLRAIEGNANLKRAYDAKIKGSAQKSLQGVNKVVSNLNNKFYSPDKVMPVIEGAAILLGKNSRSLSKGNILLGFSRVLGVTIDISQDSEGDRQAFEAGIESSWGDVVASAQARYNEILAKPNPTAAELLEAAQIAETILQLDENTVNDLLDRARKQAIEDAKNAKKR